MVDEAMRAAYLDAKRRGLIGGTTKTAKVLRFSEFAHLFGYNPSHDKEIEAAADAARIEQILREEGIIKDEYRVIYSTADVRDLGITEQYGPHGDTPEEAEEALIEKLSALGKDPSTTEFIRVENRTKVVIKSTDWV